MMFRAANTTDRPCDVCGIPMIGVMVMSWPPVRKICLDCGGVSIHEEEPSV